MKQAFLRNWSFIIRVIWFYDKILKQILQKSEDYERYKNVKEARRNNVIKITF